jgi:Leucine-rich repeat (LRR) protein
MGCYSHNMCLNNSLLYAESTPLLELVLAHLITTEQQQPPPSTPPPWKERLLLPHQQQQPLGSTTARSLHRVSQRLQASALTAPRHLRLHQYYWGQYSCYDDPPSLVPWDALAAAPSVTGWTIHACQLSELMQSPAERQAVVAAAAGRLKVLHVEELPGMQDQVMSHLAQLLAACPLLEVLELQGLGWDIDDGVDSSSDSSDDWDIGDGASSASNIADDWQPDGVVHSPTANADSAVPAVPFAADELSGGPSGTTAATTAVTAAGDPGSTTCGALVLQGPCLPHLKELRLSELPFPAVARWVQQHLGPHLEVLELDDCGSLRSLDGTLSHFSRLRSLEVGAGYRYIGTVPEDMCALTAVTWLHLRNTKAKELPAGMLALTGLRSLQLTSDRLEHVGDLSALQQLSELDIRGDWRLKELPADLGVQLPALRVLTTSQQCASPQLLTALGHITRLHVVGGGALQPLCGQALGSLSNLRHLNITRSFITSPADLSRLVGLEVLVLSGSQVQGATPPPGALAGLQQLRHLDLSHVDASWGFLSAFLLVGATTGPHFPHLTHLDLSMGYEETVVPVEQLLRLGALPRLQWLKLSCHATKYPTGTRRVILSILAPWLAQQTALTYISLWGNHLASGEELRHLPTQVKVLDIGYSYLKELPLCLTWLTGLKQLHWQDSTVKQLPAWLPCLKQLEVLDMLGADGLKTRPDVLAAMPALRRVELATRQELMGAKHLLYGNLAVM